MQLSTMFQRLCALLLLLCSAAAFANLREGVDYRVLAQPQPVADAKTVEVLEFFSYTCGHCYRLEPLLEQWEKTLPKDVSFRREQVVWQKNMEPMARLFASLRSSNELARLHLPVFHAFMRDKKDLNQEAVLSQWLTDNKVDANRFMQLYRSFSINSDVARASKMTRDYQVEGTPMIVVGGRYAVNPAEPQRVLQVTNELINKVRAERK